MLSGKRALIDCLWENGKQMRSVATNALLFLVSLPSFVLRAQDDVNSPVQAEIVKLRTLPTQQRQAATTSILTEVRAMASGPTKLFLSFGLTQVVSGYDVSPETLQAIAQTYHQALIEAPPQNPLERSMQYEYLATFMHYQHAGVDFKDADLAKAEAVLAANDADVRKADFTLTDMSGIPVTLSRLRGKVVFVNFWATWCIPCLEERHDLDTIYRRYGSRQMIVVSVTSDERSKVEALLERKHFQQRIVLDSDGTVSRAFHVSEIPHLFVLDRDGRFVEDFIGQHSQSQLLWILRRPGLISEPK